MSVTLAGSMGGITETRKNGKYVDFLLESLNSTPPETLKKQWLELQQETSVISLVVNNICNLKCKHCYLNAKLKDTPLSKNEWELIFNQIEKTKLVTISGKELTVDPRKEFFLTSLRNLKNQNKISKFGFITNGILLHKMTKIINETKPDYIDISLEGPPELNDKIRGEKSFSKAFPNAIYINQNFENITFINLTIQKYNFAKLPQILQTFINYGFTNIASNFYKPLPYTDSSIELTKDEIKLTFELLNEIKNLKVEKQFTYLLDLDHIYIPPILEFVKSKWFDPEKLMEDENDSIVIVHNFPNKTRLIFRINLFPIGITRIRINPDGNILAADDSVDTSKYNERILVNARELDYNIHKLKNVAFKSERLNEIFNDFVKNKLPLLKQNLD